MKNKIIALCDLINSKSKYPPPEVGDICFYLILLRFTVCKTVVVLSGKFD